MGLPPPQTRAPKEESFGILLGHARLHAKPKAMKPAGPARWRGYGLENLFDLFSGPFPQVLTSASVLLSPSLARLHQGAGRGALRGFLPLAALTSRAVSVRGERQKPNSRAQKKDHENNIHTKSRSGAPEQARTGGHEHGNQTRLRLRANHRANCQHARKRHCPVANGLENPVSLAVQPRFKAPVSGHERLFAPCQKGVS